MGLVHFTMHLPDQMHVSDHALRVAAADADLFEDAHASSRVRLSGSSQVAYLPLAITGPPFIECKRETGLFALPPSFRCYHYITGPADMQETWV